MGVQCYKHEWKSQTVQSYRLNKKKLYLLSTHNSERKERFKRVTIIQSNPRKYNIRYNFTSAEFTFPTGSLSQRITGCLGNWASQRKTYKQSAHYMTSWVLSHVWLYLATPRVLYKTRRSQSVLTMRLLQQWDIIYLKRNTAYLSKLRRNKCDL